MSASTIDDWDSHYARFAEANRSNPGTWYRQRIIDRLLEIGGDGSGCRLLDIGCGQGNVLIDLATRLPAAQLAGVDKSAKAVETASRRLPAGRFLRHDLMSDASLPGDWSRWATHAVCSEVLEHVDDPSQMLRNAQQLLQPGRRVIITVPGGPRSAFDRYIGHRHHYTPRMLDDLLTSSGLTTEWVGGCGFPFFNLYRLATIMRGRRLIEEATVLDQGRIPLAVRFGSWVFRGLFRLNVTRSRRGWQIAAVARVPEPHDATPG